MKTYQNIKRFTNLLINSFSCISVHVIMLTTINIYVVMISIFF